MVDGCGVVVCGGVGGLGLGVVCGERAVSGGMDDRVKSGEGPGWAGQ